MSRFVCIHGHFYQPPRENAWLEAVERQDSAHPFHDWNERIDNECYGPNGRARILDGSDQVVAITNNYAAMNYNFGPTLLSWLELHAPRTYASVLEADKKSQKRFGGHGSAMAQAWGHLIMPLCDERDRRTQTVWGVRDFERRYGRKPAGMWLPETAACTASLRALVEQGITFTILSPRQAKALQAPGHKTFTPVDEGTLDTRRAYRVDVGGGKSIAVFFYDGATSQAIAFERLLSNGDAFARRLLAGFRGGKDAELVHVATDGETYGHHHRYGEMALAYAIERIERGGEARLTNYAEFLALHPPTWEAKIHENTSWSCAHGVGRWSEDCGCRMAGDTSQAWRGPLRRSLDALRDRVDPLFERVTGSALRDPWAARDAYVDLVVDRSRERVDAFFDAHGAAGLDAAGRRRALEALEMQRHRMLMYTSCGWFFDDVTGLETTQVLQYARRAAELAEGLSGESLVPELLMALESARSAAPNARSARWVVDHHVDRTRVDLRRAAEGHAIASLFYRPTHVGRPGFTLEERTAHSTRREGVRFSAGRVDVRCSVTTAVESYSFAVLHDGGPSVEGGITAGHLEDDAWSELVASLEAGTLDEVRATTARLLPGRIESLRSLPFDERLRVVDRIIADDVQRAQAAYRALFEENAPLLHELGAMGVRPPRALSAATRIVLEGELLAAIEADPPHPGRAVEALDAIQRDRIRIDDAALSLALDRAIDRTCATLERDVCDDDAITRLAALVKLARRVSGHFDLSRPQALAWEATHEPDGATCRAIDEGGRRDAWRALAGVLRIRPKA